MVCLLPVSSQTVKLCFIQLCALPCALGILGFDKYMLGVVGQIYFKLKIYLRIEKAGKHIFSRLKKSFEKKECWQ